MKSSNLIIHNNSESFMEGNFINTSLLTEKGTIELQCNHGVYSMEGSYISTVINTSPFESLIISWNVITPKNTKIRVWGRVFIDDTWSSWLSLGTWATNSDRFSSCENISDELASVSTDTLKVNGDGITASALQYKIEFFSEDGKTTPSLSLVAATIKNTLAGQNIPLVYKDSVRKGVIDNYEGVLPVYPYSQMTKDPKIAHVMCSATSTSMVLRFHGVDITPEEVAFGLYDSHYKGFGNWIFNTAYISSFGLESYVAYFHSIEDLKRELIKGNPVIVSVRYKQPDCDKSLPVITNAACSFTFGHIIVVKGFVIEEGKEYVVVNDPAAKTDVGVSLRYALEEFLAAWGGRVAYVIHKNKAITPAPERIKVQFNATGQKKENNDIAYEEYKLFTEGQEINLKKQGPCSIMFKPQKKERYSYYLNVEEVLDNSLMAEKESTSLWIPHENILGISNLENQKTYDFRIVCENAVIFDGVLTIN